MDLNKIGLFIAELRGEKNLTQAQLSEKIGVHITTVSKWERGLRTPDISVLKDLSNALGVTIIELLNAERCTNDINIEAIKYYKNRIKKRILMVLILVALILSVVYTTLSAVNNYKQYKLFEITSLENNVEVIGSLMSNPYKRVIMIKNVVYHDYYEGTEREIKSNFYKIKLYYNNKIISEQECEYEEEVTLSNLLSNNTIYINEFVDEEQDITEDDRLILLIEYENNYDIKKIEFSFNLIEE